MFDGMFPVAFGSSRSHSSLYCAGRRARVKSSRYPQVNDAASAGCKRMREVLRGHLLDRLVGHNEILLAANRGKIFENDCDHQIEHHEGAD